MKLPWLAVVGVALSAAPARADAIDESPVGRDAPTLPAHALTAPVAPADFLVANHGFLRVVYHPSAFEAVRRITADADAARAAFASTVAQSVLEHVELRVARTPEELTMLAPADAPPTAASTGVAYPSLSLVIVSVRDRDGAPTPLDDVFRHQLAHVGLFDAAAARPLPRWLQEGLAVQMSGEASFARAQILWTAHVRRTLLPIPQLESFPDDARAKIAWAESADFVRFLSRDGTRFAAAVARTRSGDSVDRALTDAYGADLRTLEQAWRDDLSTRCVTLPLGSAATLGWGVAIGAYAMRRRRRRAVAAVERTMTIPEAPAEKKTDSRLIVCDRGLGHVAYIVESRVVPKVEHDGKQHTLH